VPIVLIGQRLFADVVGIATLIQGADVIAVSAIYLASSVLAAILAFWLLARYVWRPRIEIDHSRWRSLLWAAVPVRIAATASRRPGRRSAAAAGAILVFRSEPVAALAAGALVYLGVLACFESLVFPEDARFFLDIARARRG
jgi:hypothetical protein